MITVFHFNHSNHTCKVNDMLSLVPICIDPSSPHANDYRSWQKAFPQGLSVFGYRHMTPDQPFGQLPWNKIKMEMDCESVRQRFCPNVISRFESFFALESEAEAQAFARDTKLHTGISGTIWEVEAQRIAHKGDMNHLIPGKYNESTLKSYWAGEPSIQGTPIWECLVPLPVRMIRQV